MYAPLPLRPHLPHNTYLTDLISSQRRCWHFDAWLYHTDADEIVLVIETRAGGRHRLTVEAYRVAFTGGDGVALYPYAGEVDGKAIRLSSRRVAAMGIRDALNAMHWLYVFPWSQRIPQGFSYKSVLLHYVGTPSLPAVPDDVVNTYQHGRGVRAVGTKLA